MIGLLENTWGDPGAFPALKSLCLANNAFARQLPPAWGQEGSFAALKLLDLNSNYLTGPSESFIVCQERSLTAKGVMAEEELILLTIEITGPFLARMSLLRCKSSSRLFVWPGNLAPGDSIYLPCSRSWVERGYRCYAVAPFNLSLLHMHSLAVSRPFALSWIGLLLG